MEPDLTSQLRELSRDKQSHEKLERIVEDLQRQKSRADEQLVLLERTIRNDYDAIVITDLNLESPGPKIVYVNEEFCRMTGYSRDEVIGQTPRILQGPETDPDVLEEQKRRLREGHSFFGQTVNYRKDGSEFVNQWDVHPLLDEEGEITHWVSYQHDITERKRSEQFLVDANVEFDDMRKKSHSTVLDADTEGNIVRANRAFRELTGYDTESLKERKVWDLFPDKYRHTLRSRFENEDPDDTFRDQEFRAVIRHRNGFPIQIGGKTRLVNLKEQTLIRVEIQNISLRKRVKETLSRKSRAYSHILNQADSGSGREQ